MRAETPPTSRPNFPTRPKHKMALSNRQRLLPLSERFRPVHAPAIESAAQPDKTPIAAPEAPKTAKPRKRRASGARRRRTAKIAPAAKALAAEFSATATPPPAPETPPAG